MHRLVNTEKGYTMTTRYLRGKIRLDLAEHEYCKVAYDQGVLDDIAFMIASQRDNLHVWLLMAAKTQACWC